MTTATSIAVAMTSPEDSVRRFSAPSAMIVEPLRVPNWDETCLKLVANFTSSRIAMAAIDAQRKAVVLDSDR